jgi:hypothetical protein
MILYHGDLVLGSLDIFMANNSLEISSWNTSILLICFQNQRSQPPQAITGFGLPRQPRALTCHHVLHFVSLDQPRPAIAVTILAVHRSIKIILVCV